VNTVGWHITIDMQGGGRIFDQEMFAPKSFLMSDAVESALEDASLLHAEPGEGSYQITVSPVFR
jgi:hypothetical protein